MFLVSDANPIAALIQRRPEKLQRRPEKLKVTACRNIVNIEFADEPLACCFC
jgi:hypothetical protein